MVKGLAVFDFDHTVVDDNTDTAVIGLLDKSSIPESVRQLYKTDGWTSYMQSIFDILHKKNIGKKKITETITKIKCVDGMCELIKDLKQNLGYDVIVISDSNSYFIDAWLKENNMIDYILKVFTNPAQFLDDSLKIEMYHLQNYCNLSTKNLCKGQIMVDFIKEQNSKGIEYGKVIYAGDGRNDFCPILRLGEKDVACVRDGYKCAELVLLAKEGRYCDDDGKPYKVRSNVCVWKTGFDILKLVNSL